MKSLSRKLGMLLASTVAAGGMVVSLASVAEAAPSCGPNETGYRYQIEDVVGLDEYQVYFHWCTYRGEVVGFVVDNVVQDGAAVVDIRPVQPLDWGPTYPLFMHVTGDYPEPDDWDITLYGDGRISVVEENPEITA